MIFSMLLSTVSLLTAGLSVANAISILKILASLFTLHLACRLFTAKLKTSRPNYNVKTLGLKKFSNISVNKLEHFNLDGANMQIV